MTNPPDPAEPGDQPGFPTYPAGGQGQQGYPTQPTHPSYPGGQPGYPTDPGHPQGPGQPFGQPQTPGVGHPSYGYGGYGGYQPSPRYASWGTRVGAYLLDSLIQVPFALIQFASVGLSPAARSHASGGDWAIYALASIASLLVSAWNRWYRAGRSGQSLGKTWTGIYLVDARTGQPIGMLKAFLRDLCHLLDSLCLIGFIYAAFDDKRQTFADKIMGTVVVTR